jgi:signal transduction histidine kinase
MIRLRNHLFPLLARFGYRNSGTSILINPELSTVRSRRRGATFVRTAAPVGTHNELSGETSAANREVGLVECKENEQQVSDVNSRLIDGQEQERRRIARELHDDISQKMALLSIELEQLGEIVRGPVILRRRFLNLTEQVRQISTDLHRLSYDLHPSRLEYLGLAAAIEGICVDLNLRSNPKVEFSQEGTFINLPREVTLCVFRIAQEALRNCTKHSQAKILHVDLTDAGSEVRLSVSDDGPGFDTGSRTVLRGLGFKSMRERARIVGGTIAIRSQRRQGTSIEVSIPLKEERCEAAEGFAA